MSLELADLQRNFQAAVLAHDDAPIAALIAPGHVAGLAVHRNTSQSSLAALLAKTFTVTQRIIGARFADLAARFVTAAPPRLPHLSMYGAALADFIACDAALEDVPYLADVARLEWARNEAYFAADAPALDATRIAALTPDEMERTALRLHPATRLVRSRFPLHRIWDAHQTDAGIPALDFSVAENVLVTRAGHHLVTRKTSAADAVFVEAARAEKTLGAAVAAALAENPAFDLQTALQDHFIHGTFQD
jgi:hypothetical protein